MGVTRIPNSGGARPSSGVSMLVGAGLAVARGVRTLAARLIGAAPLADRSSFLGLLAGGPPRFYQWRR